MASQSNCKYASITLNEGDQFTLPPGAVIIAATDTSAFTSTCPVPDNLENYACYISYFFATEADGSANDICQDVCIYGIHINGEDIGFSECKAVNKYDCSGCDMGPWLQNELNTMAGGSYNGIFKNFDVYCSYDSGRGAVCAVNFKTLPSIADGKNVYFLAGCSNCVGDGCPGLNIQFRVLPLSEGNPGIHGTGNGC